jgi:hypothetical protein
MISQGNSPGTDRHRRPVWLIVGMVSLLLVIDVGCSAVTPTTIPIRERDLSQVICQGDDTSRVHYGGFVESPGHETHLLEGAADYYGVQFVDFGLTHCAYACRIYVYEDEATARRALDRACDGGPPPFIRAAEPVSKSVQVGEGGCAFDHEAIVHLTFTRNEAVVVVQQDCWGKDVRALADKVDERLR